MILSILQDISVPASLIVKNELHKSSSTQKPVFMQIFTNNDIKNDLSFPSSSSKLQVHPETEKLR